MNEEIQKTRIPVEIPGFSGPLDLLVHLVAKHEMDVFSVSIADITGDFLEHVRNLEEKNLDEAGEFLVLGAMLIRYKTRALLPREEIEAEEEEITDQILEQRRQEYERFRALADELKQRETYNANLFPRIGPSPEGPRQVIEYEEVSVYDLFQTFQRIIDEIGDPARSTVEAESFSVDEKMLEIEALLAMNNHLSLNHYLRSLQSKLEIIVVFMALLEMIRLKEVQARQDQIHGDIILEPGASLPASDVDTDAEDAETMAEADGQQPGGKAPGTDFPDEARDSSDTRAPNLRTDHHRDSRVAPDDHPEGTQRTRSHE